MIYQQISIDGVDITLAVVGWVPLEPVYLAGNAPAVVETSQLRVVLPLLTRDYGMSYETLRDCEVVHVTYRRDSATIERDYRVVNASLETALVSDDTAVLELASSRSSLLEGLLPAAYREALPDCYLPLVWPPGVPGNSSISKGLTGRHVSTSGAVLREWPGELVVGMESRAERMNWALAALADGIAVGDYDGMFDGALSLAIVDSGLRLGTKLTTLNDLQVLLLSTVGGVLYAYAAPGYEKYAYPTDYADVPGGGIYRLPGVVGGSLIRLGNWGLGREWYAKREYKSRSVFIGRDASDIGGYRIQHAQVIGSVIPPADRSEYEGYIAQRTEDVAPGEEWMIAGADEWRERRWIGISALDIVVGGQYPSYWHLDTQYPITPTVEGWSRNIFIPVTSRISITYEDSPGMFSPGDYSNGELTPDVHIYRRFERDHWTDYPAGSNGGPGVYDPAGLDLGACPQVVEPGWYAVGAIGPELQCGNLIPPYSTQYNTVAKAYNRVRRFTITIEPVDPISMVGRTLAASTEVVSIGQTIGAAKGALDGPAQNGWNETGRLYVERRDAAGALTSATALPSGAYDARLTYDDTNIWCAYTYPGRHENLWTYSQGVQPEGHIIRLTRYSDPVKHYLVATTIPWTVDSHRAHELLENMYDYTVDGIRWSDGDLYMAIRKRRRKLEKLIMPLRAAEGCWNEPGEIDSYDFDGDASLDTVRLNMGYLEIGGDATEWLKAGDILRLYIPRWIRSGDLGGDATLEQNYLAYPIEQRIVNVSYEQDGMVTTVIIDPGPDRSHVTIKGGIGQRGYCTGYWETGASASMSDDSAPADAEIWIDRGWGPWAAELWKIPNGSFTFFDLRNAVEVIETATQEYQHTVRPRYENGAWVAPLKAEPVGEVEVKKRGYKASVIDLDSEPGVSFQRDPGEVEIQYTGTSQEPYAWAGDYIVQGGGIYQLVGDSLVSAYPTPSVDMTPVGDGVIGGDGHTYLPVAAEDGARMLVVGLGLPPGMGLVPLGESVRTLSDWLKIPAVFGCRQGPGNWNLESLPSDALDISTTDVLDWWYDSDYTTTKQLPVKYGEDKYYPDLGALSLEGEPESVNQSGVICSAPDAAHIYAWRAMIGAPVLGRFYVKHRITATTLEVLDQIGMLHRYDFGKMGVLLRVTTDLDNAIMTAEYADIGGLGATGL